MPNNPARLPQVPDHELFCRIGSGAYGEVWLARSVTGCYRAVKVVYRRSFSSDVPFEREFAGIQKFEAVSRSHNGLVDILHVGKNDVEEYFYYVMELADDASLSTNIEPGRYAPRTLGHESADWPLASSREVCKNRLSVVSGACAFARARLGASRRETI